ncbi:F-box protein SKIP23-like [Canna indica]|uniref:F-box protein SKIP23-like n=1 Tax=Canna indica TaxID=4628 RepID=A0AAQ3KRB5_9LILI|nr:F-box protein SKIP23-like [Canna indica]
MNSSWSDLPVELLGSIIERLPFVDRIRFSAVCSYWHYAAGVHLGCSPAPQSPWLMLPFNPLLTPSGSSAAFFSLADRKAYKFPLPDPPVSDRLVVGSSHGWLITADSSSELHLLNPVTGDQIRLPSVTTFPFVDAVYNTRGRVTSYSLCFGDDIPPESFEPDRLRYFLYEKAVLSAAPTRSSPSSAWGGFTVMLIHNPLFALAFARSGDEAWALVDTPSLYWVDAIFSSSGQFLTLESMGRVEAWDLDGARPASALVAPSLGHFDCSKYLVELPQGQLLQVQRWKKPVRCKWEPRPLYVECVTTRVKVFRLKADDAKGSIWVENEGENLREFALFLGKNSSMCVSEKECAELRGDCVYFTDDGSWSYEKCHEVIPDVGVFDMKEKSLKPCGGYDFRRIWPPPVWIMPTLK